MSTITVTVVLDVDDASAPSTRESFVELLNGVAGLLPYSSLITSTIEDEPERHVYVDVETGNWGDAAALRLVTMNDVFDQLTLDSDELGYKEYARVNGKIVERY